jgi:hypothetical protein
MRLLLLCTLSLATLLSVSCSKKNKEEKLCGDAYGESPRIALQPYLNPQWDPTGNLVAFNHIPVSKLITNTCGLPYFGGKADSAGLYLIKNDGTGFTRVTDRPLEDPKWSPDGKWLAYNRLGEIWLLPFNGTTFDTAAKRKITPTGQNATYAWSPDSDSLYYLNTNTNSVNATFPGKFYRVAVDGSGVTMVGDGAYYFWVTSDRIYFNQVRDIFSTKKDGSDKQQHTTGSDYKYFVSVHNGIIYFESNMSSLWSVNPGNSPVQLDEGVHTYDVSSTGEIVYGKFRVNTDEINAQNGTLWIMNADGSNKRQLTFNHHK